MFRGKKNSLDIGKVVAFNDEPEMDAWDGDECNQYVGTDSTIFAPYMDVNDGIWAYEPAVCRSLGGVNIYFIYFHYTYGTMSLHFHFHNIFNFRIILKR